MTVPTRDMTATEDHMLTPSQVAALLYIHVNTVKRISDRGDLPFYRVNTRGDRRYRLSDIQAYVDKMTKRRSRP